MPCAWLIFYSHLKQAMLGCNFVIGACIKSYPLFHTEQLFHAAFWCLLSLHMSLLWLTVWEAQYNVTKWQHHVNTFKLCIFCAAAAKLYLPVPRAGKRNIRPYSQLRQATTPHTSALQTLPWRADDENCCTSGSWLNASLLRWHDRAQTPARLTLPDLWWWCSCRAADPLLLPSSPPRSKCGAGPQKRIVHPPCSENDGKTTSLLMFDSGLYDWVVHRLSGHGLFTWSKPFPRFLSSMLTIQCMHCSCIGLPVYFSYLSAHVFLDVSQHMQVITQTEK